ncbi:hypothetical protein PHMEG_00016781 [Phytophthora megakarya]|uniref:Uncharacterized protein n=1 Tax=Phytophthora megakarya TaxID=4795 RepID=A0A225VYD9_9STRA|nr:hypothetical protein PHMEG_00016781 [Phytophthora megakarya]
MWIPASRLTREHGQAEIMASLAAASQPAIWTAQLQHLRDFQCYAGHGISFVCVSEEAQALLGNTQLMVCGSLVTIRKYSKYDKLYYVDLRRLPLSASDPVIYDYFVALGERPVMITPTQVHGQINSRDRTVYFNRTECPPVLKISDREAVREIYFDPDNQDEKPCFVQHRTARFNRTTPPSLRKPQNGSDTPASRARTTNRSGTAPSTTGRTDSTTGSNPDDSADAAARSSRANDSASANDSSPLNTPRSSPFRPRQKTEPRFILGSVAVEEPEWKLVQHSQYGMLDRAGEKYIAPAGQTPCELTRVDDDPHGLKYEFPVSPNYYELISDAGFDDTLPPDADIYVEDRDANGMDTPVSGFTADTALLPFAQEVLAQKNLRKIPDSVENVTVKELEQAIDDFLKDEVLQFTHHDDTLAAIQVQPAYLRRIFRLPSSHQHLLFLQHALYRALCAEPVLESDWSGAQDRLRDLYGLDLTQTEEAFKRMFQDAYARKVAREIAICDLFLMVFAPGIYIDPIKVAMLTSEHCARRIRHSPFLLWSDITLLLLARSELGIAYCDDGLTPDHVVAALQDIRYIDLPASSIAGPSRWIHPQL